MQSAVFEHVAKLIEHQGADIWFEREEADLLPPGTTCGHCGGGNFQKEKDILDVWFDSGASHAAVLDRRPELGFPADLYLEGSDQHRGWFQVSLLTAMGTRAQAPFYAVLTHGYTVDGEGKKMSKSLGNFITAEEGIQKYGGADLLRLWVVSENIQNDVRISQEIMTRVTDTYRRVRNSLRFLLGNLRGFDPNAPAPLSDMSALDRAMLHRLAEFVTRSREAFEQYETYRFYQALQNFCSNDLSAFYFDAMKDCLYADGPHSRSRHAVQTVLWWILQHLTRLIAPVLVHTADETWQAMREQNLLSAEADLASVHLAEWLAPEPAWQQAQLATEWEQLGKLRDAVMKEIEKERAGKNIRHTYEAMVRLEGWSHPRQKEPDFISMLEQFFVVSKIEVVPGLVQSEPRITILAAPGTKCERCWRVLESVGQTQQHPTLCQRCAEVVTALEPKPLAQEPT
jgi:isoleucyl-tRNA synthetase